MLLLTALVDLSIAQESDPERLAPETAAIRETVVAYADAFNKGDSDAIAAMWTEDAVYTNRMSGEVVSGRTAIAEQFKEMFASGSNTKMELATDAVKLLSPHVAVEHGTARLLSPNAEPEVYRYVAVYIKQGDKWLLDRVTDEEGLAAPYYSHLQPLEWMVGSWRGGIDDVEVRLSCNWTTNHSFLTRSFSIVTDEETFSGTQIIGWDPVAKSIRCWTFDQNGTFADGMWANKDNTWTITTKGTLPNGGKSGMINIMTKVDENSFTWKTLDRISGGEMLPSLPEITIVRESNP
jgi:uncharacterized protein (TIGR02246 family)